MPEVGSMKRVYSLQVSCFLFQREMLYDFYKKEVVSKLMSDLGIKNPMRVPKLVKIVVNSSLSDAIADAKVLDVAGKELSAITGQKPAIRRAKKSIAAFKLRQGMPIGLKVTLRRKKMYEFLNRLINVALPRSRDFKGLPNRGFDGSGNYTFGLTEQILFPEISHEKVDKPRGMNVTIVTTAANDKEGLALLKAFNFPIRSSNG